MSKKKQFCKDCKNEIKTTIVTVRSLTNEKVKPKTTKHKFCSMECQNKQITAIYDNVIKMTNLHTLDNLLSLKNYTNDITQPYKMVILDIQEQFTSINKTYFDLITIFESPLKEQLKQVDIVLKLAKEFKEDKEQIQDNLYHILTQNELTETIDKNEKLENEINTLKKELEQKEQLINTFQIHLFKGSELVNKANKPQKNKTIHSLKPNNINQTNIDLMYFHLKEFLNCDKEQLSTLFSNEINKPLKIELPTSTTMKDLCFLFSELHKNKFILTEKWISTLSSLKVFYKANTPITSTMFYNGNNTLKATLYKEPNTIIETLIIDLNKDLQ